MWYKSVEEDELFMTLSGSRRVANICYQLLFPELVGLRGLCLGQPLPCCEYALWTSPRARTRWVHLIKKTCGFSQQYEKQYYGNKKGGCWEWAGRDKRSTRGASLRPLQFCPAGISKLWYILNSMSVESICQPTIIPSWIGHSFSTFQAVVKGNTKKATEQLCEITQSPLFRFVFACYPYVL